MFTSDFKGGSHYQSKWCQVAYARQSQNNADQRKEHLTGKWTGKTVCYEQETGLLACARASFGLTILVLVKGGGQSRGQTAVSLGRVKASFGLRALVLVQRGGQSSGQTAVSF